MNARYGRNPGFSFYTHLSDQFGPFSSVVMSATNHEAPYVLDGLLHHGTQLNIGTHYTDTGGASDHVFILCAMLGILFCPRLRDLPDRCRVASRNSVTGCLTKNVTGGQARWIRKDVRWQADDHADKLPHGFWRFACSYVALL